MEYSLNTLISVEGFVKETLCLHCYLSYKLNHLLKKSGLLKMSKGSKSIRTILFMNWRLVNMLMTRPFFFKVSNVLNPFLEIVSDYSEISGAKLNVEKTAGIVFHANNAGSKHGIKLNLGPERMLGIPIGINVDYTDFWNGLIFKLNSKLNIWKHRDLSFEGKAHLIKSTGISQLVFAMDMIHIEDKFVNEIDKIVWQFLWSEKKCTVKRDICTLPRDMGGG